MPALSPCPQVIFRDFLPEAVGSAKGLFFVLVFFFVFVFVFFFACKHGFK